MGLPKYDKLKLRLAELEGLLADQAIVTDKEKYQKLAKEFSDLTPIIEKYNQFLSHEKQLADLKNLLTEKHDKEFEDLMKLEVEDLNVKQEELLLKLEELSNPDANADRNLIIEIRAGTGGEEASLFAADLYRMYTRYADRRGWKVESMEISPSDTGGFKEVIFSISGRGAQKHLKWESGAHRVQRVPSTEASGRIHTSAATVAVLFEPEVIEIKIDPKDLKVESYRSSGPGGQSVNTTDSAIRITHLPTGVVVTCQDERSQLKNKAKAFRVLRARLLEQKQRENFERETADRRLKIGSGDRSEKIRTYNFSDHRITDHRIGFSTYKLNDVLDGDMDELTDALIRAEAEDNLKDTRG